jgi:hypothetical protein
MAHKTKSKRQAIAIAKRRFLKALQEGPCTFTSIAKGIELPDGVDGRCYGPMVAELRRDGIIEPSGFAPSANTDCFSRRWQLVEFTISPAAQPKRKEPAAK